ncbi:MAG: peptide/nickel transport system substrate-binding protein [Alphaproteobacteria bacterium]|jgi:peptide/nickel transport system substrate-binding protein
MEGLVRRDAKLRLQPALATSWQQLSPLQWRFHLRRGVEFHDGSPFSADDVIFSFDRARGPQSQQRMRIPAGLRIEKVDQHTVDFHLATPNPILHVNWEALLIMSSRWARQHKLQRVSAIQQRADDRDRNNRQHLPAPILRANGTGPYRITYHRAGEKTLFARNSNWWSAQRAGFARIEMHTVRNPQTRTAALLSGQVDLIVPAPLSDLEHIDRTVGTKTITGPELRTIFLNMDQMRDTLVGATPGTENPLRDVRVRRAIHHAIDAEAITRVVMRGRAVVASSLMSPLVHPGVSAIQRLAYDPTRARELLADAGYRDGFTLPMDCSNDRYLNDAAICQAVAGMLGNVGIRVALNIQPKSLFFAKVLSGGGYNSAFSLIGWTPSALDGSNVLTNVALCRDAKGNGARFNLGGYCNRNVDRLLASVMAEPSQTRRAETLTKALQLIHSDVGFIPLHQQTLAWAMSTGINATVRADNQIRFSLIRPHAAPRM